MISNEKLEAFTVHQTKVREQIESLLKSVFLLSGTALTISIGLFNSPLGLKISTEAKCALKISWGSLFVSIVVLVLSLSLITFENYRFGMRWLRLLTAAKDQRPVKADEDLNDDGASLTKSIEILLCIGILLFLMGMLGLAWAAVSILH